MEEDTGLAGEVPSELVVERRESLTPLEDNRPLLLAVSGADSELRRDEASSLQDAQYGHDVSSMHASSPASILLLSYSSPTPLLPLSYSSPTPLLLSLTLSSQRAPRLC